VTALDPTTGRQLWRTANFWGRPERRCGSQPVADDFTSVASDANLTVLIVYCGDIEQDETRAVERSGRLRWTVDSTIPRDHVEADALSTDAGVLAVRDGAVVTYGDDDELLRVLDPATGRTRWTTRYLRFVDHVLALDDRSILLGTVDKPRDPTTVTLRDLVTGAQRPIPGFPAHTDVVPAGGHADVLIQGPDKRSSLVPVDLATGRVGTSIPVSAPDEPVAAVVDDQGYALITGRGGGFVTAVALGPTGG
jgi:hypothetical protein